LQAEVIANLYGFEIETVTFREILGVRPYLAVAGSHLAFSLALATRNGEVDAFSGGGVAEVFGTRVAVITALPGRARITLAFAFSLALALALATRNGEVDAFSRGGVAEVFGTGVAVVTALAGRARITFAFAFAFALAFATRNGEVDAFSRGGVAEVFGTGVAVITALAGSAGVTLAFTLAFAFAFSLALPSVTGLDNDFTPYQDKVLAVGDDNSVPPGIFALDIVNEEHAIIRLGNYLAVELKLIHHATFQARVGYDQ